MKTEYELKILDVDVSKIKEKLFSLGAKKKLERNMRRYVYDIRPGVKDAWIRLRDNGQRTTLTIKEIKSKTIDGTKEIEIQVDDFDMTNVLLEKLGFRSKAYQENKRHSFALDGVDVEIDFWPMIPPYLEVEGKSAEDVERVVKLLGFDLSETTAMGVTDVYEKYGINIHRYKELKF